MVPWQLPESSANFFGAAIGSSITVFAATWLADSRERQKPEDAKELIRQTFEKMHFAAKAFCKEAESFNDQAVYRQRTSPPLHSGKEYFAKESRFQVMLPVFESARRKGLKCYGNTKRAMDALREVYGRLTSPINSPAQYSNPGAVVKSEAVLVRACLRRLFDGS